MAVGSLGGCGAPADDAALGPLDETVATTSAPLTTSPFTLRNYQTGLCLGVKAGTPELGTPLIVWRCDTSANQRWTQGEPYPDPTYIHVKNDVADDRCLSVWRATDGDEAFIFYCSAYGAAYDWVGWKPIYVGNDFTGHECYRFESKKAPGKVLGVKAGSTSWGASAVIWSNFNDPYGHPDQIWCVY